MQVWRKGSRTRFKLLGTKVRVGSTPTTCTSIITNILIAKLIYQQGNQDIISV